MDRSERFIFFGNNTTIEKSINDENEAKSHTDTLKHSNENKGNEINHDASFASQKDFEKALSAIQSFFKWFSSYRQRSEEKCNLFLKTFVFNKQTTTEKKLFENYLTYFNKNLEKNEVKKEDIPRKFHSSWETCEGAARRLYKKMLGRVKFSPYPLLCLYTSQDGMLSWFGRRIAISYDTLTMKREMQFKEIRELNELEQTNRNHWYKRVDDVEEEHLMILMIYQSLTVHLTSLMQFEFQILDLEDDTARCKTGILYRGEIMSAEELTSFREKLVLSQESMSLYKTFCNGFCSTTTDESIAIRFLASRKDNLEKVLHIIHIVNPTNEEIEKFRVLFHDHYVQCQALDIKKYSEFPDEKEVLIVDLPVLGLDVCLRDNGIWQAEYVASTLDVHLERHLYDANLKKEQLDEAMNNYYATTNSDEVMKFYQENPDDLAVNYFSLLTMSANYRFVQEYYSQSNHQNSYKVTQFSEMIDECDCHLKLLTAVRASLNVA